MKKWLRAEGHLAQGNNPTESHYAHQATYFGLIVQRIFRFFCQRWFGLRATFTGILVVFCGSSPHLEEPSAPGTGQN